MLALLTSPEAWISLATLTALEIVLGIDNIVFITILTSRLPPAQQHRARRLGLGFALVTRIALLATLSWLMRLTRPLFTVLEHGMSGRDLILLGGGLFLIAKSTMEMYEKLELDPGDAHPPRGAKTLWLLLIEIMVLDIVFSLDSVITAVGMVQHLPIMILAMIIAVVVMMVFAGPVGDFVERHPSMKVLALSFLLLIGVLLVAESLGHPIAKGYVYFAMAFSLAVELLNMRVQQKRRRDPVELHDKYAAPTPAALEEAS
ncbi:MAG: TerC family protein [Myxococcota bacterium]